MLVSWAVPKGPSYGPSEKRMAIHVEDHPLSYGLFEGTIPAKQYGAGTVIVWDNDTWEPIGDPREALAKGKLAFTMHGQKMAGLWELVKTAKPGDRQEPWILFKKRDEFARSKADYDVVTALPDSVIAKPLAQLTSGAPAARTFPPAQVNASSAKTRTLKRSGRAELDNGTFYDISFERSYKDKDDKWQNTSSVPASHIQTLRKLLDMAHTFVLEADAR